MLESINIVVNGEKFNVKKGITFLELSKMIEDNGSHKVYLPYLYLIDHKYN